MKKIAKRYVITDGILYRIKEEPHRALLAVPQHMRTQVLRQRVHWKGMTNDLRQFVASCPTCQPTKMAIGLPSGELQLIAVSRPNETLGADFVGPAPTTLPAG